MAKKDYGKYKQVVSFFKKKYLSSIKLKVRRVPRKTMDGSFIKQKTFYSVYINNSLVEDSAIDAFLHELAHVLSWSAKLEHAYGENEDYDDTLHDSVWGIRYAELYRMYTKEFAIKTTHNG